MEAADILQLPRRAPDSTCVRVEADHIEIEHMRLADRGLAATLRERPEGERPALVERALRIGLMAIGDAGASMDAGLVRREFEAMVAQTELLTERMASQLDEVLRANFADVEGRLPRTMEAFLGDRGQLRNLTRELFDDERRDSAIGRLRTLLGSYFDGDASRLAHLLDPTRLGSPLHHFRREVSDGFERLNERLAAIEAAASARADERSRSSAKGADFEELVESLLAASTRGTDHVVERTTDVAGDVLGSRKGDFVITLDPQASRGAMLRVVVECKDRSMSGRAMRDELAEARRNRDAAIGLVIFSAQHAPTGIAPFDVRMGDVYCVIDPEAPEPANLDAALRLARLLAASSVREADTEVDAEAVAAALARVGAELDAMRGIKVKLTTIGTAAQAVNGALDQLKVAIVARISEAEALLVREAPTERPRVVA